MPKGKNAYGECYRAVEMLTEYKAKTVPVQMIRRWPDGREEDVVTAYEPVAYEYTTLDEAVRKAAQLYSEGKLVMIDHMPDGRSGNQTGYQNVVSPNVFSAIAYALTEGTK